MSINDEFELEQMLGEAGELPEPPKKKGPKKAQPAASAKVSIDIPEAPPPAVEDFIDPEDDRENWPTIKIDAEEGAPNYAYIGSSGTKKNGDPFNHELQIMRGVEVKVPPSVVYTLMDAVATHIYMRRDPVTGRNIQERQDRSATPWRLVRGGKYFL